MRKRIWIHRCMYSRKIIMQLSRQLKALEEDGLIIRTEYAQIPPKVEYSLSDIGMKVY